MSLNLENAPVKSRFVTARAELSTFVVIVAVFMVAAIWIFPEAGVKKGDVRKAR